jgi:hypothetical protein
MKHGRTASIPVVMTRLQRQTGAKLVEVQGALPNDGARPKGARFLNTEDNCRTKALEVIFGAEQTCQ